MSDTAPVPDATADPSAANQPKPPPPTSPSGGTTLVSVPYGTVFEHGIEGVPALTFAPQAIPAASLTALRDVAATCGVKLTEEQ